MDELTLATSVAALLRRRVREKHDDQAVAHVAHFDGPDGVTSWTYGRLDEEARAVAARLRQRHSPGDRALLLYPVGLPFVAAFLGCQYAGVIAVPAPEPGQYSQQRRRLRAIATDADVRTVLTDSSAYEAVLAWRAEDRLDHLQVIATDVPDQDSGILDAGDTAETDHGTVVLLQYTSGSTGDAKGVMITNGNMLHNAAAYLRAVRQKPGFRSGGWLPLYHDMGLSAQLLPALMAGGTCHLMQPMTFVRRPHLWLRMIDTFRLQVSHAPNFAYELCQRKIKDEQVAGLDLSCWEYAGNGSEPVQASVLTAFAKRFADQGFQETTLGPSYGMAETVVYVSGASGRRPVVRSVDAELLEQGEFVPARLGRQARHLVGCGQVETAYDVRVVDPVTRRTMPPDGLGEIWLRGPSVSPGYWRRKESSRETFDAQLADGDGGWLRTGDLGIVVDGEIFVSGRIKDMLIVRGRNLYPHDIENELRLQHPELGQVGAAFGVSSTEAEPAEERVVVTHEVRGNDADRLAALGKAMKLTVAREFGTESTVALLRPGSVLRTTSGKVRRGEMRRLYLAGELAPVWQG
ncbi:fatty acyl-AMP ligase [Streptomyces phaeochromogenes]